MADKQPTTEELLAPLPDQPAFAALADGITPEIPLYATAVQDLDVSVKQATYLVLYSDHSEVSSGNC